MKRKLILLAVMIVVDLFLVVGCIIAARGFFGVSAADAKDRVVVSSEDKLLALTFDDGPSPDYTKLLLDGLKERNVKASFFLMGENIPGNEELVRQMAEDGHLIGSHGYSHVDFTRQPQQAVCESIGKTNDLIEEITGKRPEYVRPPYGNWTEELSDRVEMTPVFWNLDSLDWKYQNTAQIVKKVLKKDGNYSVVLMHDIFPTSVEATLQIVDVLHSEGYTFVTVDELLID